MAISIKDAWNQTKHLKPALPVPTTAASVPTMSQQALPNSYTAMPQQAPPPPQAPLHSYAAMPQQAPSHHHYYDSMSEGAAGSGTDTDQFNALLQLQQQISQSQLEKVANYINTVIGNLESHMSKKMEDQNRQRTTELRSWDSKADDQAERMDSILTMSYVLVAVVVVMVIIAIVVLWSIQKRFNQKILDTFQAVTKSVIQSNQL